MTVPTLPPLSGPPSVGEARAVLCIARDAFYRAQESDNLPEGTADAVREGIVLLAEYLIGRPPRGSAEVQMIARGAAKVVEALRTFDDVDVYLHDGGYSRLLVRPLDVPPLCLSGVSLDGPKARWAAIVSLQSKGT